MNQMRVTMAGMPEHTQEIVATVRGLLGPTRVSTGCLDCRFSRKIEENHDDVDVFELISEWQDRDTLDVYLRGESVRILLNVLELMRQAPEIVFRTVAHVGGIEVIATACKLRQ